MHDVVDYCILFATLLHWCAFATSVHWRIGAFAGLVHRYIGTVTSHLLYTFAVHLP